jgi:hypothetical protein
MFNLTYDETTEIKFKLSVVGTSAKPAKVFVSLGNDEMSLCFAAKPIDAGDEWVAHITPISNAVQTGSNALKIEVLLNGKLHNVVKREVTVGGDAASVSATIAEPTQNAYVEPTMEPVIQRTEPEIPVEAEKPEPQEVKLPLITPFAHHEIEVIDLTKGKEEEKKEIEEVIKQAVKEAAPTPPKENKKIELDFKSIITEVEKKEKPKTKSVKKKVEVTEMTTVKTPFTVKRGKIITK